MHGDTSFVPEVLPIAPRPIAGELISSWLLRVSVANGLILAELVQGIESRFPEVPLRCAFIDEQLSPCARSVLAKFLRVTEYQIKALELRQQFPFLPMEWILRSIDWELVSPHRFLQGRAMYGFCPICIQEMCHGSKLNQPAKVEMTQPVEPRIRSHEKRGIFLVLPAPDPCLFRCRCNVLSATPSSPFPPATAASPAPKRRRVAFPSRCVIIVAHGSACAPPH
jgi:TniQ